jgi:Holliday junction resolvase RusA-like endonuclease
MSIEDALRKPLEGAELDRYIRLSRAEPRRLYLDAVDAERRSLELHLESDELLRQSNNRAQKARMDAIRADLKAQVRTQLRRLRRRAFRGPVSVELDLHAVAVEQPSSSPPAVKAYLDLLKGLVYEDDRSVCHLRVARHARDNPLFREAPEDWLFRPDRRMPHGPPDGVAVRLRIMPLRVYTADYDRAFRLRDKIWEGDGFRSRWSDDDGHQFWESGWQPIKDDDRLDELRAEHREDLNDEGPLYGPGGLYDDESMLAVRTSERQRRVREYRALRHKLLLDQRPQDYDRPGPRSELDELIWSGMGEDAKLLWHRDALMAGSFFLPLPPETSTGANWRDMVRDAMEEHRRKFAAIASEALDTGLALDISVRGAGTNRRDLDNLARDVLVPFEQLYCADERGTVVSYRVYEAEGPHDEVRVLVMTDSRLHQLEDVIAQARHWNLRCGPQFD